LCLALVSMLGNFREQHEQDEEEFTYKKNVANSKIWPREDSLEAVKVCTNKPC
jgi:hypothetical protein